MRRITFIVRGWCNGLSSRVLHPVPFTLARVPEAATVMVEGDLSIGGGVWGNPLQSGGSQTQTHFPGFANLPVAREPGQNFATMAQFRRNFSCLLDSHEVLVNFRKISSYVR